MNRTGTSILPFLVKKLPTTIIIIQHRLTHEVKIIDSEIFYELKCCICVDGSRMVVGIDYDSSYVPVIEGDGDLLLLVISLGTSKR